MIDLKSIVEELRKTNFLYDLLETLIERGLGTLPARETALTFVDLLLKYNPEWKNRPPEDYELARLLKTSPRKIRTIRDDLAYRDTSKDDNWCREKLSSLLLNAERIKEGEYVSFEIDDGLLREYAKKQVRDHYGVFDTGINNSVVKISGNSFLILATSLLEDDARNKLIASIPQKDAGKSSVKKFIENFMQAAGNQAGKKTVDLGFTILTGGLSDVIPAIEMVTSIFKKE